MARPHTLQGLQVGTTYTVRVRTVCENSLESAAAVNTFTTGQGTQSFIISATTDGNSTITPFGNVTVAQGANQTFTISPLTGFEIDNVLVDDASVGVVMTYTFTNVQANGSIRVVSKPLNIDDYDLSNSITVFPNPTTGKLMINIDNNTLRIEKIAVFNVYGKNLYSSTYQLVNSSTSTIDISHLPAGIYFLMIETEKESVVKKVVKN